MMHHTQETAMNWTRHYLVAKEGGTRYHVGHRGGEEKKRRVLREKVCESSLYICKQDDTSPVMISIQCASLLERKYGIISACRLRTYDRCPLIRQFDI